MRDKGAKGCVPACVCACVFVRVREREREREIEIKEHKILREKKKRYQNYIHWGMDTLPRDRKN